MNKGLLDPIYNLLDRNGKKWRPIMCFFISEIFGCEEYNFIYKIAGVSEIIHNGSLIIDDIEDESDTRRK